MRLRPKQPSWLIGTTIVAPLGARPVATDDQMQEIRAAPQGTAKQVAARGIKKAPQSGAFIQAQQNCLQLLCLHEVVETRFCETEPQVLVFAECGVVFVDLFPVFVFGTEFAVQGH